MAWTSYLPTDPARLSTWERNLWIGVALIGVLLALVGYVAYEVTRRRADIEGAILEDRLVGARSELEQKDRELASANAEAQRKLDELELRQAPRRLTATVSTRLHGLLQGQRAVPVNVTVPLGDGEARQFASDLLQVLKHAGWRVDPDAVTESMAQNALPAGVHVVVSDWGNPPPGATVLVDALAAIAVVVNRDNGLRRRDEIRLFVGRKPDS